MGFFIQKIVKDNQVLNELSLNPGIKFLVVPLGPGKDEPITHAVYPTVFVETEEQSSVNLLDHFWTAKKKCVEICGVNEDKGFFTARSLNTFTLKKNSELEHIPRTFKVAVITLSDRASAGEYNDLSGAFLKDEIYRYFLQKKYSCSIEYDLICDDEHMLVKLLDEYLQTNVDLIVTTGGTGIGPRDITVPVVQKMIDYELPGIMDLVRIKYGMQNPAAVLSRSIAGIANKTLIFCLPGSLKAVKEYWSEISTILLHAYYMLYAIDKHS
ncbi:MAG TPA: MogA/MoaB family molybdenum cofactor biosynthesis protein [Salinivirgaceae bacterium]|nr:MogA/MoaB family molybdenum cofactor biosynthesis protein [Salinivirgaceae bacterium]